MLLLFVLGLWQVGLIGYTYVLAGHAAQEGARIIAVNPSDGEPDDAAYKKIRARAMGEVPKAWRRARRCASRTTSRPSPSASRCRSCSPACGRRSRSDRARDGVENEDLPPSQAITPEPVS